MGYEGQNFVKTDVNQCYILILLVCLQKFELFGPGLEYSPHTVVLNKPWTSSKHASHLGTL